MDTQTQSVWTLTTNQFLGFFLYACLVPAVLFLMSAPMPGAKALAIIGVLITLPFWPLASVPIQIATLLGGAFTLFLTACAFTLLQAWIALALLRKRAHKKGTKVREELVGVIKRSTVFLVGEMVVVIAVLFWLKTRP